jgi:hypothetical protein
MKGIKITVMMLLASQALVAQTKTPSEHAAKRVERMEEVITLTAEQKTSITAIVEATAAKASLLNTSEEQGKTALLALRKEEKAQINALLTDEQKATLKETKESRTQEFKEQKALKMEKNAERKQLKNALHEKRIAFDSQLSAEEKAIVEKARSLQPVKIKEQSARAELTESQKNERKKAHKEVVTLLKPVVKKHQAELDAIEAELPNSLNNKSKEKKQGKNNFAYRFILMT